MARPFPVWLLLVLAGCATSPDVPDPEEERPPSTPRPASPPDAARVVVDAGPAPAAARAAAELEAKHLSEKEWLAGIRKAIGERWKVDPGEVRFSASLTLTLFVQAPPAPPPGKSHRRPPPPRPYTIVVVDNQAQLAHRFRPVQPRGGVEPPKDVQFLGEDRLVYEVVLPPPPPPPPARPARAKHKVKHPAVAPAPVAVAPPAEPERLFVIQPLRSRARPLRCQGRRFALSPAKDHLAFVVGQPGAGFVSVDGVQTYPRGRGRTAVASDPAWSKDGLALAFVDARPAGAPQLVLLADVSNETGDTTWDLPASPLPDGLRVFWAGADKLVVGKSLGKPIFAATFAVERPAQ